MRIKNVYKFSILIFTLGFLALLAVSLLKLFGIFDFNANTGGVHYHLYTSDSGAQSISKPVDVTQLDFHTSNHSFFMGHSVDSVDAQFISREEHAKIIASDDTIDTTGTKSFHNIKGYYGIDVSHWQQKINWSQVVTEKTDYPIKFVIIKATQGKKEVDPYFTYNWLSLAHTNKLIGAYHFYKYSDDPVEQATHFLNTVSFSDRNILPVLDIELDCSGCKKPEIPKADVVKNMKIFLDYIEKRLNVKPIIYTYESFYKEYLEGEFDDYYFWMAKYSSRMPVIFAPDSLNTAPPSAIMWQFTSSEKIDGIVGHVDMSFLPDYALKLINIKEE